jgi:hypothetical protein
MVEPNPEGAGPSRAKTREGIDLGATGDRGMLDDLLAEGVDAREARVIAEAMEDDAGEEPRA